LIAFVRLPVVGAAGLLAFAAAVVAWIATVLTFTIGLVFAFVPAIDMVRRVAGLRRLLAGEWEGATIASPYRGPTPPIVEPDGRFRVGKNLFRTLRWANWNERQQRYYVDPATWRDVLSATIEPVTGVVIAMLPAAMWVWAAGWVIADAIAEMRHLPVAVIVARVLGGLALMALSVVIAPTLLRWHGRWTSTLLAPTEKARLAREVERLTETRTDAIEVQAAEVRRIERDLHDGAQARLIAVGLTLGLAEQSVDADPAKARALIVAARDASETALIELRNLVRGIHPPVLAERGLGDAVRALALDCPLPVGVTVDLPGTLPAPVESAAYFVIGETIANAVRHAAASRIDIELTWRDDQLSMTVTDDGSGGADPAGGSGLIGIARRLGSFDGTVAIVSPAGGPTEIRMELPCELSSPKTSSC
jgi:signal transduction histidine kinase